MQNIFLQKNSLMKEKTFFVWKTILMKEKYLFVKNFLDGGKIFVSDLNGIQTHNYLVCKQKFNHLAKLAK